MSGFPRRLAVTAALMLLLAGAAPAYYHFIHFFSPGAPYIPAPERFDLNALVDRTVRYFISESGLEATAPGDSYEAIVSQIRLAGEVWNNVGTSELRVGFGGVGTVTDEQSTPAISVLFDEIPPGVIALGGPTAQSEPVFGEDGAFIPISRSVVILNKDLSNLPSSSEGFFLTLVHEIGHALGLQHTLTSAVMSTSLTRGTTKANPLDVDDIAGISLLYPTREFLASMGAISGRVAIDGAGVNLASVVALSPQGAAISALTNPDGTYRIEGIPPGVYYVYAHPLPPPVYGEVSPANIVLPRDPADLPLQVGPLFETQFFPGVKTVEAAVSTSVQGGAVVEGVDFHARQRDRLDVYAVSTYSFPGNVAVKPGHLSFESARRFLVAGGVGLMSDGAVAPGLRASVIGGSAFIGSDGLTPYWDTRFLQINLSINAFSGSGARHLLFSRNNDIYVLPSGLHLTQNEPPLIDAIASGFDPAGGEAVAIAGRNMSPATRFLFDGRPAPLSGVSETGILYVTPPPAPGGHRAKVVALNPDGQSSLFFQGNDVPEWAYAERSVPSFSILPRALPAGAEAMIEIRAVNTQFVQGLSAVGFGSSDVVVRGVWVLSPTQLIANVYVTPTAAALVIPVTVVTGIETVTQMAAFEVQTPAVSGVTVHSPAVDAVTGDPAYVGGVGAVVVSGLAEQVVTGLTLSGRAVNVVAVDGGRVLFEIPVDLEPGPSIVRLSTSQGDAAPVVIEIYKAPPAIAAIYGDDGAQINGGRAARHAELLTLVVANLTGEIGDTVAAEQVKVVVGDRPYPVHQVVPLEDLPGYHLVQFVLGTTIPPGEQILVRVSVNGRRSAPVPIAVSSDD